MELEFQKFSYRRKNSKHCFLLGKKWIPVIKPFLNKKFKILLTKFIQSNKWLFLLCTYHHFHRFTCSPPFKTQKTFVTSTLVAGKITSNTAINRFIDSWILKFTLCSSTAISNSCGVVPPKTSHLNLEVLIPYTLRYKRDFMIPANPILLPHFLLWHSILDSTA